MADPRMAWGTGWELGTVARMEVWAMGIEVQSG